MRYSNLFTKTIKQAPGREESLNSKLLLQAGFIDKTMSGVYTILPLGLRVLKKIKQIVREEMDAVGSQEIFMPSLTPKNLWETTGRLEKVDVLFEARGANKISLTNNQASYVLNSTHEEVVTPLVQKHVLSYKDLPISVYQIQNKFRNEPRAKSGLLRCREFLMKDLYSFHASKEDLKNYYEQVKEAYVKVFDRLGIGEDTYITLASGGDFTDDYSHEFQTKCPTGEDLCFYVPSDKVCFNQEIAPSKTNLLEEEVETELSKEEIETKNITTVEALAKFLQVPISKTTKTLLYETDTKEVIATAIRGDYEINELKLKKVLGCSGLKLASEETIKKVTGAEVGYIGLLNLDSKVKIVWDDSLKGVKNLEMGANKTNYHVINVNFGRDIKEPDQFYDIKMAKIGDLHPETGEEYQVFKASEVGNIFILDTKYAEDFNFYYTDEAGAKQLVYMGCYGLGPTRVMGILAEKFSDQAGLVWPDLIAPFQVHLISLNQNQEADKIYNDLQAKKIEVLYDDRTTVSAGEKFADADLIGCPVRLVVSQKTVEQGKIEWKTRKGESSENLILEEILLRLLK